MTIISLDEARNYLDKLDLDYIVRDMCSEYYSLARWTLPDALHCCQLYKNFLLLNKKYLPVTLVPSKEIDEFWHNHILYTQNYHADCQQIFGFYLHHLPAARDDSSEMLAQNFLKTKELYFQEFQQLLSVKLAKN